jgi:hypothetical protein
MNYEELVASQPNWLIKSVLKVRSSHNAHHQARLEKRKLMKTKVVGVKVDPEKDPYLTPSEEYHRHMLVKYGENQTDVDGIYDELSQQNLSDSYNSDITDVPSTSEPQDW